MEDWAQICRPRMSKEVPITVVARTLAFRETWSGGGLRPRTATGECRHSVLSGRPRLTSAVRGEYARKLLRVRRFCWSQACSLGTVNPSRKLRRFESFTCHHVLRGPLTCGNASQGPFRGFRL